MKYITLTGLVVLSQMICAADQKPEVVAAALEIKAPATAPKNAKKNELDDQRWREQLREFLEKGGVIGFVCEKKNCNDRGLASDVWDEHGRSGLE